MSAAMGIAQMTLIVLANVRRDTCGSIFSLLTSCYLSQTFEENSVLSIGNIHRIQENSTHSVRA